jgi:hypothetical protein
MTMDVNAMGKVAVLMGGSSAEREISLMSGRGVLDALRSRGAYAFDPAERELSGLRHDGFSRVFVALHGRQGEDGSVQGALELLGIPYTGSGVMASAIAMDKVMTKRVWLAEGLPTPRWVWLAPDQQQRERIIAVPDALGLPLIVKPPREGSSIGVSKVEGYSQMQPMCCAKSSSKVMKSLARCWAAGPMHKPCPWCASRRRTAPTTTRTSTSPTSPNTTARAACRPMKRLRSSASCWLPTARWAAVAGVGPI